MRVVALTGGFGSGKSTVSKMLEALGARIVDADRLAREVVEPGTPALAAIVDRFGREYLDAEGRLDRKKLSAMVFHDPPKLEALNAIVHPAVRARSIRRIGELANEGAALVIYDVPLLFETGLEKSFPDVIVVFAEDAIRRARAAARDGLSLIDVDARIAAQLPLSEKRARATWVIDNNGSLEDTRAAVTRLYEELTRGGGS